MHHQMWTKSHSEHTCHLSWLWYVNAAKIMSPRSQSNLRSKTLRKLNEKLCPSPSSRWTWTLHTRCKAARQKRVANRANEYGRVGDIHIERWQKPHKTSRHNNDCIVYARVSSFMRAIKPNGMTRRETRLRAVKKMVFASPSAARETAFVDSE